MKGRILVTGASGFVGRALVARFVALQQGEVMAMTRVNPVNPVPGPVN